VDDENLRCVNEQSDGHEIRHRIIGEFVEAWRNRESGGVNEQRVPIRRRARNDFTRYRATRAWPILDDDLLAPDFVQPLGGNAGSRIDAAAGSERYDDPDRLCRITLGEHRQRAECKQSYEVPHDELSSRYKRRRRDQLLTRGASFFYCERLRGCGVSEAFISTTSEVPFVWARYMIGRWFGSNGSRRCITQR
jgi:hypothetical protein